jgi:hypothetical protein
MTARRTTSRSLTAAGLLFLGLFAMLLVSSAGHDHYRHDADTAASCVFCSAALAVQPAAPILLRPLPARCQREVSPPLAPELPYLLKLDHSGGAPPAA